VGTVVLLLVCAPYAAVAVGYFEARKRREKPPGWARLVGLATVVLHLAGLVALSATTHRSPFQTESQALSFLAFSLGGLYVVLEATSRVATYGGGFYLLTAILAASGVPGLSGESAKAAAARASDPVLAFHIGFALLGTAAIVAGGLLAAGYLGVYRRAKGHRLAVDAGDSPSLTGLQALARHASVLGLVLLGPSLVLGAMALARGAGAGALGSVQIAVSGLQFAIVLAAAFLWWRRPLRGATAAWLNVTATGVAVVSFAVVHPLLVRATGA
jgi:ABC-type uncharacterized transport system permease subunit